MDDRRDGLQFHVPGEENPGILANLGDEAVDQGAPVFSTGKKFFSKIGLSNFLNIANTHLCAKNQKKLMMKSRENVQKPVFPAYFRHFRPEMNFFLENRASSLFGHCHFAPLCQNSEKTNEPIPRKAVNRRTNERTNEHRLI